MKNLLTGFETDFFPTQFHNFISQKSHFQTSYSISSSALKISEKKICACITNDAQLRTTHRLKMKNERRDATREQKTIKID